MIHEKNKKKDKRWVINQPIDITFPILGKFLEYKDFESVNGAMPCYVFQTEYAESETIFVANRCIADKLIDEFGKDDTAWKYKPCYIHFIKGKFVFIPLETKV